MAGFRRDRFGKDVLSELVDFETFESRRSEKSIWTREQVSM